MIEKLDLKYDDQQLQKARDWFLLALLELIISRMKSMARIVN